VSADRHESVTIELNPRERRLYDRVRIRMVEPEPGASTSMRDVILLLPDLVVLLTRLLRDPRVPRRAKLLAMVGVGYVLSPIDVLPGLLFGPIGLVDDVVIATATLSRLLNHVHPDVVRSHWSGQGDALEVIQRVTLWSESLFTARLPQMVRSLLR
jgi:uncharacterized membrane protein YkvA (DUF1232 family)